jgi:murein DD-endopeptidase MepM/ murein hydrolase activator NlpD
LLLVGIAALLVGCFTPPTDSAMPCPVTGTVEFVDDFGDPRPGERTHQGIDIFAPRGRPNVAVADGRIEQRWDTAGGNTIRLSADDDTRYVYAHLDRFAGAERTVETGEVIGYTGDTGNAMGTHTHFEIRPDAGAAVNPYPTLVEICPDRT